jgi:hypothetical protein
VACFLPPRLGLLMPNIRPPAAVDSHQSMGRHAMHTCNKQQTDQPQALVSSGTIVRDGLPLLDCSLP